MWFKKIAYLISGNKSDTSVEQKLKDVLAQAPGNLQVNLYYGDQILFQIMQGKNFVESGFVTDHPDHFVELHFFNKNKTNTAQTWLKFKDVKFSNVYYSFEKPKGNYNFIKEIGSSHEEIYDCIQYNLRKVYDIHSSQEISIEYLDY